MFHPARSHSLGPQEPPLLDRPTHHSLAAVPTLPDHFPLAPKRQHYSIEQLTILLKGGASAQLREDRLHPFQDLDKPDGSFPKAFGRDAWHVYLNTPQEIVDRVDYAKQNLIDRGMKPQMWDFVTKFVYP